MHQEMIQHSTFGVISRTCLFSLGSIIAVLALI
ncbi:hypothetical protein VHP8226_01959 [Vibrio hippocampi]|uniref:DUF3265 domain-containing protein n=1 Tax=Vibrio hippocampi TaxID=654686 RepID=A0ABM8ZIG5_9VIBR|nr:hypothetical protein VHP8226_01959 [Vibrio hippocampi]